MTDPYFWLTPVAILVVLVVVGFVGCDLVFDLDHVELPPSYTDGVLADTPTAYWRLQETSATTTTPGGTATDEVGSHHGTYIQSPTALSIGDQLRTPAANPILIELGAPGLLLTTPSTSVRVQGAGVEVPFTPDLNPAQFTLEMLVEAEWNINAAGSRGFYYCVIESSDAPPEGSGQRKSRGFAIYAGPEDLTMLNTPYRWQCWVGTGSGFVQLKEVAPNDGSLVTGVPTYLAVTFDGAQYTLWVYTQTSDVTMVKHVLVPAPYAPSASGELRIGLTGQRRALVGPAPGPNRDLYPFSGRIQEVAVYGHALSEERIISHLMGAFTT